MIIINKTVITLFLCIPGRTAVSLSVVSPVNVHQVFEVVSSYTRMSVVIIVTEGSGSVDTEGTAVLRESLVIQR